MKSQEMGHCYMISRHVIIQIIPSAQNTLKKTLSGNQIKETRRAKKEKTKQAENQKKELEEKETKRDGEKDKKQPDENESI